MNLEKSNVANMEILGLKNDNHCMYEGKFDHSIGIDRCICSVDLVGAARAGKALEISLGRTRMHDAHFSSRTQLRV
jgi:hypothetical protein